MKFLDIFTVDIFTISDLKRKLRILKEYLEKKIFGGNLQIELTTQENLWLKSLPDMSTVINAKDFSKQMTDLTQTVDSLTPLVVYLAFNPSDEIIRQLTLALRKMFNSNLIFLDIKQDPGLLGGAAFVYKGIYKDYSLRAKLEQNREKILLELKRDIA